MNTSESQVASSQPKIIEPIRAGFNIAANHLYLLLFPFLLDLWIWLGLHLSMKNFLSERLEDLASLVSISSEQINEFSRTAQELLVDRFNIMLALRSYPVGVPSLMTSRMPVLSPFGQPYSVEVLTIQAGYSWLIGLTLTGMALGTIFYLVVSRVALRGELDWIETLKDWPRAYWQVINLFLVWLAIVLIVSIPFSCLVPVLAMGGVSQFALFLYMAVLGWLFFPLILSAHGIFVYGDKMTVSLMKSVQLARLTMPTTTLFILLCFLATLGLDIIWRWPKEDSFLVIVGLAGHAFVTTALLAASFIYYHDANQWIQTILRQVMLRKQVS